MKYFYLLLFIPFNLFSQWESVIPYPTIDDIVYIKAYSAADYFIIASGKHIPGFEVFTTADSGENWRSVFKDTLKNIRCAYFMDSRKGWAVSNWPNQKLMLTSDGGLYWRSVLLPVSDSSYTEITFINNSTGYILSAEGILKSTDGGESWEKFYSDSSRSLKDMFILNENFIAAAQGYLRITTNGGTVWKIYSDSLNNFQGIHFLDTLTAVAVCDSEKAFRTTDGGETWYQVISSYNISPDFRLIDFHGNTGLVFYNSDEYSHGKIYFTTDRGENWNPSTLNVRVNSVSYINDSSFLTAGDIGRICISTDYGNTLKIAGRIGKRYSIGRGYFSRKDYGYFYARYQVPILLHTPDGGKTFFEILLPYFPVQDAELALAVLGDSIIIARGDWKFFRSTNKGYSWSEVFVSPPVIGLSGFSFPDTLTGYFASETGMYKTADAGVNWMKISSLKAVSINFTDSLTGFYTSDSSYLFKTTDGGSTWFRSDTIKVNSIKMLNSLVGIASGINLYYTYDGGISWNKAQIDYSINISDPEALDSNEKMEVFESHGKVIGYIKVSELYYSVDSLRTWHPDTRFPIPSNFYYSITSSEGKIWASGEIINEGGYLLKRENFGDLIVTAEDYKSPQADTYFLACNYPNPFNPFTTIRYSIPVNSNVIIKIFDITGSEVEILVNEEKQAGLYEIRWDASAYSSGVYFYRLQAGEFISTKKLLLMK